MHRLPNLTKSRHGVYYLRLFKDGKERRFSLHTKDWAVAKLHAHQYHLSRAMNIRTLDLVLPNGLQLNNIHTDDDYSRAVKLLESIPVQAYLKESAQADQRIRAAQAAAEASAVVQQASAGASAPVLKARTKRFSEVVADYLAQKKLENVAKTLEEKAATYEEFKAIFGDVDTNSLGSEQAISFKNRMVSEGQSVQRINKKLSMLKDFFAYAITHKSYFDVNPFDGLAISKRAHKAAPESYEEFTDDELKLIFENPLYKKFMNKPDYHWLPFLGLFTGARIESLASLKVSQVCTDGNVTYLDIRADKNANSVRKVPLHARVIAAGFLDYVKKVKAAGKVQLFPHLKPGKNGYSKNCSRRFGQYLDKLDIKDSRKVFHSLRSTFINRITNEGVHAAIIMGIVGHYEQKAIDFSLAHMEHYQKKKPLAVLKDAVNKVDYGLRFAAH